MTPLWFEALHIIFGELSFELFYFSVWNTHKGYIHPCREVRNLNKNAWNFRNKHHRKTEQLKDDFYWCSLQWLCFIWLSAASIPSSCFLAFPIPQMALLHKIHSYIWPNHVVMHADDDGDYGCLFKIPMFRIFIPKTVDYIEEAQSVSWCLLFFKADIFYVFFYYCYHYYYFWCGLYWRGLIRQLAILELWIMIIWSCMLMMMITVNCVDFGCLFKIPMSGVDYIESVSLCLPFLKAGPILCVFQSTQ